MQDTSQRAPDPGTANGIAPWPTLEKTQQGQGCHQHPAVPGDGRRRSPVTPSPTAGVRELSPSSGRAAEGKTSPSAACTEQGEDGERGLSSGSG